MTRANTERPLLENPPQHTLATRLSDALEFSLFYLLRLLPLDFASDIGSFIVRQNIRFNRPWIRQNARANLRTLRPDWDDARVEQGLFSFQDNVGRLMAEFANVHRFYKAGRIEVSDRLQASIDCVKDEPTLMLVVHTGNWEVFPAMFQANGVDIFSFAVAPETWAQRVIASKVRNSLGVTILPPDRRGLHRAKAALNDGQIVAIFADEARDGVSMAPLFGRKPHRKGNLALAVWLAQHTGVRILLGNCVRTSKSRFFLDSVPYFSLPEFDGDPAKGQLEAVAFLNAKIEPLVRDNLDQWYFLDDALTEIG
ncbi:MAG: hypothetical protein KI785_05325 [Devosiaceae bacterium]|nr:hypothetical protein [Devosiaceae bacterium MH13]